MSYYCKKCKKLVVTAGHHVCGTANTVTGQNVDNRKEDNDSDSGSFIGSAIIGAATGNAVLGGLLGGDLLGGIVGSSFNDD